MPAVGWVDQVIRGIGAPVNRITESAMAWWAASEGMPDRYHNPLATSLRCCGGTSINRDGVKTYPDWPSGVQATIRTIKLPAYRNIVSAFRDGTSLRRIWLAIHLSPWCASPDPRGCQGGKYPIVLFQHIEGGPGLLGPFPPSIPMQVPTLPPEEDWSTFVHRGAQGSRTAVISLSMFNRAMQDIVRSPVPRR